jgi:hypothetical protein
MSGLVTGYELNSTFYPPLSRLVTGGHGLSQLVTGGHGLSQLVTGGHGLSQLVTG